MVDASVYPAEPGKLLLIAYSAKDVAAARQFALGQFETRYIDIDGAIYHPDGRITYPHADGSPKRDDLFPDLC